MKQVTYKGRKLKVTKSKRFAGYLECSVNGQVIDTPISRDEDRQIERLKKTVDAADADDRPGAYGDYMFEGATK